MAKMGKSTLIGLLGGIAFIVGSLFASGHADYFWNLPSAFITIGGTLASVVMSFPPKRLKTIGKVMKRPFIKDRHDIKEDIFALGVLAEVSRREGLLALDDAIDQYTDDDFIKRGIRLIVDGADEDQLRAALEGATYFMKQRHKKGAAMIDMIASTAPALGLLGTYVGLIPMLNNLDDPTTLGPMMALELVSSFYGAFIAYVVFSPLAKRLKNMSEEEESRRELLIEGLVAIQQGRNPRLIRESLAAYMNIDLEQDDKKKTEANKVFETSEVMNQA